MCCFISYSRKVCVCVCVCVCQSPAPCVDGCSPVLWRSGRPFPVSYPPVSADSIGSSPSLWPRPEPPAPAPHPASPHCPADAEPAPTHTHTVKILSEKEYKAVNGSGLTSNLLTCPLWNSNLFSRSQIRASCLLTMLRVTVDDSRNCTRATLVCSWEDKHRWVTTTLVKHANKSSSVQVQIRT